MKSPLRCLVFLTFATVGLVGCGKTSHENRRAGGNAPAPGVAEPGLALMTTYCMGCHQGVAAPADVRLDTDESLKAHAGGAQDELDAGSMPPKDAPQPATDERATLKAWFASKA